MSSGKIWEEEYLTYGEKLPTNESQMIEHTKFKNSPLGKTLENQTKKQLDTLKSINLPNKIDELKKLRVYFLS